VSDPFDSWYGLAGGAVRPARPQLDAVQTESMHFVREPRLAEAVRKFLVQERRAVAAEVELLHAHTARRRS